MEGVFEDRLVKYANLILLVSEKIKMTDAGRHLKIQLIRSGTSASLNYGEALSAESDKDLLHKFRIMVKELRETYINLKILRINCLCLNPALLENSIDETNQLISIFVKSIQTVRKRQNNDRI
jgi:four helix bundle protein